MESSVSVQHNESSQETRRKTGARTRKKATQGRRQVSELISPARQFHPSLMARGGTQYLQSWPRLEMSSCGRTLMSTHHVVLECQPITLFLTSLECWLITLLLRQRPSKNVLTVALLLTAEATLGKRAELNAELLRLSEKRSSPFLLFLFIFPYF